MKKKTQKIPKGFSGVTILIMLFFALIPILIFHTHYQNEQATLRQNPLSDKSESIILERVKRRMQTTDVTPRLLLIKNKDVLKKAPYYAMIQNNNIIIFYKKANMGFVYNPQNDVITAAINTKDFSLESYEDIIR